ncbi:hypothetical protein PCI56_02035 [Plesiomonas shigelloides subsp. oncorhynchi]|nr:hypothetical protein [Plesiomonas shigelloides]
MQELLAAGIDVYTTLNVQHLESLNDLVWQLTGVRVKETLPDQVLLDADSLVLIDLPPKELLERLREGKVYVPHQAKTALQSFFRSITSRHYVSWRCKPRPAMSKGICSYNGKRQVKRRNPCVVN